MLNSDKVVWLLDTKERIPSDDILVPESISLTIMGCVLVVSIFIKIILILKGE